jgi:hypothetical protein
MRDAKKIGLAMAGIALLAGILILFILRRQHASPSELRFSPVSLSEQMNGALYTSWLPNEDPGNNLASLPTGLQELGGVLFDVQGLIQLQGQCWVKRGYALPERVEGIPVHRACRRVHILHANSGFGDPLGTVVASLVLHYPGGQEARLDIRHRQHVLDFWTWGRSETPADTNSVVAWTGDSPATQRRGFGVRLCRSTFENPQPGKVIESIDYVSAMAGSAPFLVAVTLE